MAFVWGDGEEVLTACVGTLFIPTGSATALALAVSCCYSPHEINITWQRSWTRRASGVLCAGEQPSYVYTITREWLEQHPQRYVMPTLLGSTLRDTEMQPDDPLGDVF